MNAALITDLQAGASEVDITPTGEDWLGHRYQVHDPLKARIAVFRGGGLTVAFIGAHATRPEQKRVHSLGTPEPTLTPGGT